MTLFVFSGWGSPVPSVVHPGEDVILHLPVQRYGNALNADVEQVRIEVFRYASDLSHVHMVDRDGVTLDNVLVTTKDGDDTFVFRVKVPGNITRDIYLVRWSGQYAGTDLPDQWDRFRVDDPENVGDVEIIGTEKVA